MVVLSPCLPRCMYLPSGMVAWNSTLRGVLAGIGLATVGQLQLHMHFPSGHDGSCSFPRCIGALTFLFVVLVY
jgi:hypothetical protein